MLLTLVESRCNSLACDFRGDLRMKWYKEACGLEWYLKFPLENEVF